MSCLVTRGEVIGFASFVSRIALFLRLILLLRINTFLLARDYGVRSLTCCVSLLDGLAGNVSRLIGLIVLLSNLLVNVASPGFTFC